MPTSLERVRACLEEESLRYHVDEENDAIVVGFLLDADTTTYRDSEGKARIQVVIRVLEGGEFVAAFTPQAWSIADTPHRSVVLEALVGVQSQYKMVRFDHDPADGEIRPNVELPLEEADVAPRQLHRMIHGIVHCVQRYDAVIRHAKETGVVSWALVREDDDPPGSTAADAGRLDRLLAEAGGLDALERLAGGIEEPSPPREDAEPDTGPDRLAG